MFIKLLAMICSLILILQSPEKAIEIHSEDSNSIKSIPVEEPIQKDTPILNVEDKPKTSLNNTSIPKEIKTLDSETKATEEAIEEPIISESILQESEKIDNIQIINKEETSVTNEIVNNIKDNQEEAISKVEEAIDKEEPTVAEEKKFTPIFYDRTTSIYDDDAITLLRIEYYKNNKLLYYSTIEHFDAETHSYTEKIYHYDFDTDIEYLIRTDCYKNGQLTNSY